MSHLRLLGKYVVSALSIKAVVLTLPDRLKTPFASMLRPNKSDLTKTPETLDAAGFAPTASIVFRYSGTPDAIRTHGLQSRSLSLYPAELRAHIGLSQVIIAKLSGKVNT